MALHRRFVEAAAAHPGRTAVETPEGGALRYAELDELSGRLRDRLVAEGIRRGDRVGLYLHKSIDSVATLLGVLKAGAAYVPVDPTAPAGRNAYIFADCGVRAVVVEDSLADALQQELTALEASPPLLRLSGTGDGTPLRELLDGLGPAPEVETVESEPDDLAYILYTSGSTGRPKGVMLSHRNAERFVDWCHGVFEPTCEDRFSSHAPFHFDLSILDLYTPLGAGATLVLISEDLGKEPMALAPFIAERGITAWYSTPSILALLTQYGNLQEHDYSALRIVNFAGEVFPIVHLKALKERIPHPRYFNLYGPTETNVCTWYELPAELEVDRVEPYPIGRVCEHYDGRVVDAEDRPVEKGGEGELLIAGDGVMRGYWNLPEQSEGAFVELDGRAWYRTGDLVVEEADGNLRFVGRKDRMVKKRGYRVELGEIEACLYRHEKVREAAVVAIADDEAGLKVRAHLATRDGERISLIALKAFCSQHLPLYMVPDLFQFHEELPKTSTDKTDYQRLKSLP